MYKILIDTRDRKVIELKLEKDGTEFFSEKGDFDVIAKIQEVLTKYKIKPTEIAEIVPTDGPGSLTGLKVGFTVANVFNWATGKKQIGDQKLPTYGSEPFITPPKKFKL